MVMVYLQYVYPIFILYLWYIYPMLWYWRGKGIGNREQGIGNREQGIGEMIFWIFWNAALVWVVSALWLIGDSCYRYIQMLCFFSFFAPSGHRVRRAVSLLLVLWLMRCGGLRPYCFFCCCGILDFQVLFVSLHFIF